MWMWFTCTLQGTEACLTHTLTISILYTWLNIHLELKSICVWSHAYIRCILGCNHIWCKFWYALPVIISVWFSLWLGEKIWHLRHYIRMIMFTRIRGAGSYRPEWWTWPIITHVGHVSDPKKNAQGEAFQNYLTSSPDLCASKSNG